MGNDASFDLEKLLERLQNRREFLQLFGKGLGYSALVAALPACGSGSSSSSSDEDPPAPPLAPKVAIPKADPEYTALKRTSFGPHRDEMSAIRTLGITDYLEQQLNHQTIPDGTLEADIQGLFPLTIQNPVQLLANFPDNIFDVATQMIAATQYRQMFSKRQLFEIMVEFWSDHFNIHLVNGLGPTLKPFDDQQVIREHALGNFSELLHASAKSSAMLFYLDNYLSVAGAANENYARELMELHTLGVDGGYTETDVKEVARCFTGWTLHFPGGGGDYGDFFFNDVAHDDTGKEVLGNSIDPGGKQMDGEDVLDILAAHPSTANFIASKLCRRFISDTPPQAAVDAVAAAFTNSIGDIKDTLRALFATPAFLDNADQKFTRPSEYLAALVRSLAPDTGYPPDNGLTWFYAQNTLGQIPFYWPTPDGFPDHQDYWASTGGLLNRWRLSFLSLASLPDLNIDVIDVDYTPMLGGANTLATVVDAIVDAVLMRPLSSEDRSTILEWLKSYLDKTEDQVLEIDVPELAAALTAAVLVSSVYFHLR
jgi:uncharacterized protein (DUF1800 family)